jgi:predicted choloylglycine hydrolase
MSEHGIPVMTLTGTHREMGRQHGLQIAHLRPQILAVLNSRLEALNRNADLVVPVLKELELVWMEMTPSTLEMLRGIADTLEIPFVRLLQYAVAPYLEDILQIESGAEACTVWAALGPATRSGSPILTKNRDCPLDHLPLQALAYAEPRHGYRYLYVTSAGSPAVFSSGMNEQGLTVADTHVPSRDIGLGVPRYTLMMELLEGCATVDSALIYLQGVSRMGAGNLILADAQGELAVFEVGYRRWGLAPPMGNTVLATNHFVSLELSDQYQEARSQADDDESRPRHQAMQALLNEAWGTLDAAKAMELMAQHKGSLAAICRHNLRSGSGTISNGIFFPAERKLLFCNGSPCQNRYKTYSV